MLNVYLQPVSVAKADTEKLPDKPEEEPNVKLPTEIEDYLKTHPDGKLWLMRLEGYTWTEISQKTNLKYATVMQRKNRLERDMRKKFGGAGGKSKGGGKGFRVVMVRVCGDYVKFEDVKSLYRVKGFNVEQKIFEL